MMTPAAQAAIDNDPKAADIGDRAITELLMLNMR
jgi:hypothetical protein